MKNRYYDGNGNLTSKTDAKSQTISFAYDYNNRLTGKTYPDSSTATYTYDASSNLLTVVDNNTNTVNAYDDLNRLTVVTNTILSKVIQYTYWEDGTRKTMLEPEGALVEYTYDKAKRLLTVKRNSVTEATYQYNALGLRTRETLGNGSYTENTYDGTTRWLIGVYNRTSTDTVISSFVYTLDKIGNRTSMTLANNDVISYTFDATYQLTNELRTGNTAYQKAWTYDEVGNRLTQWDGAITTTSTYNDANQLIESVEGGITTTNYTYDANGNQTGKTIGANTLARGTHSMTANTYFN